MRSNKWIFNNILLLSLRKSWRDVIRVAHSREKRFPLRGDFFRACRERSLADMLAVFDPASLLVLKLRDPRGKASLRAATRMRRELRRAFGNGDRGRDVSERVAHAAFGTPGHYPEPLGEFRTLRRPR
jgi:hypothetical protein